MDLRKDSVNSERISVIVPAFNSEAYLSRCLDSILNQTYPDVEIVVINDGSTDKTQDVIDSYMRDHENIIAAYQQNSGTGSARNLGVRISSGEYVTFVDSDDAITEDYCSSLHGFIDGNDIVVGGRITYFNGQFYNRHKPPEIPSETGVSSVKNVLLKKYNSYTVSSKLCRKSLFDNGDVYFPECMRYEDMGFSILSFANAKSVAYVNREIYIYYVRGDSTVALRDDQSVADYVKMIRFVTDEIRKRNLYDDCAPEIGEFLLNALARVAKIAATNEISYACIKSSLSAMTDLLEENRAARQFPRTGGYAQ